MMRKNSAITFIELLVVIIIIGILGAVSIPQFRKTFDDFALNNFGRDIYYLCRYLQASAISQAKIHLLKISKDTPSGRFNAFYQTEGEQALIAVEGRFGKSYLAPENVMVTSEKSEIYFYPDGSLSEAEITFENNHGHKLSLGLNGASGGIKIK